MKVQGNSNRLHADDQIFPGSTTIHVNALPTNMDVFQAILSSKYDEGKN